MQHQFHILKTPLNCMLLCEAITRNGPLDIKLYAKDEVDEEYLHVYHNGGPERSKAMLQYIALNNPSFNQLELL